MNLSLKVEHVADVTKALEGLGKHAPKAVQLWTNWVGLEAQGRMRAELPNRFHLRGTADQFRKAVVFQSASASGKRKLEAVLKVGADGVGGTKASATKNMGRILARHEEADTRTESSQVFYDGRGRAMTGLGFYLPAKGMRTASTNPARKQYPASIGAALRLTPESTLIRAKGSKKGSKAKGTGTSYFATRQGIFERRHTSFGGRVEVRALWWFKSRVRTPARLGLWDTAQHVFESKGVALGLQAVDEAMFRATL